MPDPGWWEALWPDPAKVLRDVGVAPGMDVIDLCCGDGWFTWPLARMARSVIAIDIDAALLEAAKLRMAERGGAPHCRFIEADAFDFGKGRAGTGRPRVPCQCVPWCSRPAAPGAGCP